MRRQPDTNFHNNLPDSAALKIMNVLHDRKNQLMQRIVDRLHSLTRENISNSLFGQDGNGSSRWTEPNLLTSGLVNFNVSGNEKLHFKLSLSFTGFLYLVALQKPEMATLRFFNNTRQAYDNFGFSIFEEHEPLANLLYPQMKDDPEIGSPGKWLFQRYREDLFPRFLRHQGGYYDSIVGWWNTARHFMIPEKLIDSESPSTIYGMIEGYQPAIFRPLLKLMYEHKRLLRQPAWSPLNHWQIARLANLEHDEMSKFRLVALLLEEFDYSPCGQAEMSTIKMPLESLTIFKEVSKIAEDTLNQFSDNHKKQQKIFNGSQHGQAS